MNGQRWTLPLAACAAVALGCTDSTTIEPTDVFVVSACPAGWPCEAVADGRSLVTIEVCVPGTINPRIDPLTATFQLSSGRWQIQTDAASPKTYTTSLARAPCAHPAFITPTQAGPLRVDVTVAGIQQSVYVEVEPAPLRDVTLKVTPPHLAANAASDLAVSAVVRAQKGGSPSEGTDVRFQIIDLKPEGSLAYVLPERATIGADGVATAQLSAGSTVTLLTLEAIAEPPDDSDGKAGETVSADLTLQGLK